MYDVSDGEGYPAPSSSLILSSSVSVCTVHVFVQALVALDSTSA